MAQQFNFDSYNSLMKQANTGLKLHFAVSLLKDVVDSLERFDNPLLTEVEPILTELKVFHSMYKASAKKAAEARTNDKEVREAGGRAENASLLEALAALQAQVAEMKKAA